MPASPRRRTPTTSRSSTRRSGGARMVFGRRNYMFLLASIAAIVIGFAIMRIENEVHGFVSLYVAPLVILAGYAGVAYAILWQPREAAEEAAPR